MKEKGRRDALIAAIIVVSVFIFILIFASSIRVPVDNSDYGDLVVHGKKVGLIEIIGPIYDSRNWCRQIDDFRKHDNIKAIVIRIDSPGGGVAASQELYNSIKRASDVKPVIASLGSVAASGGYYAAIAADTIVANPGTTTGSIGVLMEITMFHELMDKIGVEAAMIKSGEYKDTGWPFRELTNKDKAYLQGYVDDAYQQFIEVVADERQMEIDRVKKVADGRIYTGRQAFELGLVDVLGDQYTAVNLAGELCNLGTDPQVVKPPKRHVIEFLDEFMGESTKSFVKHINSEPAFQYRWRPEP